MIHESMNHVTTVGTIFGGLFALITLPTSASIISAVIIAGIGATTGFFVTLISCAKIRKLWELKIKFQWKVTKRKHPKKKLKMLSNEKRI